MHGDVVLSLLTSELELVNHTLEISWKLYMASSSKLWNHNHLLKLLGLVMFSFLSLTQGP